MSVSFPQVLYLRDKVKSGVQQEALRRYGATTFSITTVSITTFRIKTLSIKGLFATLSIMTLSITAQEPLC